MKKKIAYILPIAVLLTLTAALFALNRSQIPAWRVKLNQYITYLQDTGQSSSRVISTTTATLPSNFSPAMSGESYGDNIIFETSHSLNSEVSTTLQPVPYPPAQVMCVLLSIDGQQQLVFVALHQGLYNADWIVHISPDSWGSPALQENMATLGCSLDV